MTLQRLRADPLALRVPTLQAEGALEGARAGLSAARLASYTEATAAYFGALEANTALGLAEDALELERAKLRATQIRYEVGAATGLELLQAENRLAAAERRERAAQLQRLGIKTNVVVNEWGTHLDKIKKVSKEQTVASEDSNSALNHGYYSHKTSKFT